MEGGIRGLSWGFLIFGFFGVGRSGSGVVFADDLQLGKV